MAKIIIHIPNLLENAGVDVSSEPQATRAAKYITQLNVEAEKLGHTVEPSDQAGDGAFYSVSGDEVEGALEFMMRDHVGDLLTTE